MLKHVVIEGVDGSGKTTLMRELSQWRPRMKPHNPYFLVPDKRSSTSIGGPVPELDQWVEVDSQVMQYRRPTLFDRHPLISEPIYGPICRGILPGKFNSPTWLGMYRERLAHQALVIWCCPPFPTVEANVRRTAQMNGVTENIEKLYQGYRKSLMVWPGVQLRYDYTRTSVTSVLAQMETLFGGIRDHAA